MARQHPCPPRRVFLNNRFSLQRHVPAILWALTFAAIPFWIHFDAPGWDFKIYLNALHSLRLGHDPYADGIAVQRLFHLQRWLHPNSPPPYTYVYSPITLPILRAAGFVPHALSGGVYWLLYAVCALLQIWVGLRATEPEERRVFAYLAPVAMFFPNLLVLDVVLSGNVAYILYGAVLLGAYRGWQRNRWAWFYLAVLIASCFKGPMLSLLAIPVLSARKQWLPVCLTGAAGIGLFGMQAWIWPSLFRNYLAAVELQFSYNSDFGFSPAGRFGHFLVSAGIPYSTPTTIFYLLYAFPMAAFLFYLSRQFHGGRLSFEQWMPVMLVGVLLLNPRVMTYDGAPIALPLALILWRFLASRFSFREAVAWMAGLFAVVNVPVMLFPSDGLWRNLASVTLASIFSCGCWDLYVASRESRPAPAAELAYSGMLEQYDLR